MNIIILTSEKFPLGGAASNRIISYSRGLIELGCDVNVLVTRPADRITDKLKNKQKGVFENIKYSYLHNKTNWPKYFIIRVYTIYLSYFLLLFKLLKININKKNIIYLISTDNYLVNIIIWFYSKIFSNKFYLILDEYPFFKRIDSRKFRINGRLTNRFRFRLCDGMILISDILIDYYKSLTSKKTRFLKIPILVEMDRFNNVEPKFKSCINEKYIIYCGLEPKIDGIDLLLNAFSQIHKNYNFLKIIIVGDTHERVFENLKKLCIELNISDKVNFTGLLSRNEIPEYLLSASLLVLPRIITSNSISGFPTKLGEYLSTKKPVLVSNIGEISNYLKDNESCFFVEPNNVNDLKNKIIKIFDNYEFALDVGEKGYQICKNNFNYKIQSEKLFNFIK